MAGYRVFGGVSKTIKNRRYQLIGIVYLDRLSNLPGPPHVKPKKTKESLQETVFRKYLESVFFDGIVYLSRLF